MAALVDKLFEHGYPESDCKKFLGGNFYRVFQQVWRYPIELIIQRSLENAND